MDIFIPFPVESDQLIQERLSSQLGTFQDEAGKLKDYVSVFNHDVEALNNLLNKPPSIYSYYEKAVSLQTAYNESLAKAQTRWQNSEKSFEIGSSVIKDLTEQKKRFESAHAAMNAVEEKNLRIRGMLGLLPKEEVYAHFWDKIESCANALDKNDRKNYKDAVWCAAKALDDYDKGARLGVLLPLLEQPETITKEYLIKKAIESDKGEKGKTYQIIEDVTSLISQRTTRLKNLKTDWLSQGVFAQASAKDLLKIKIDLQNFKSFLDFIENGIHLKRDFPTDEKIKNIISINKRKLARLEQNLLSAMSWRVHAASIGSNVRFDDNHFALMKEIRDLVFIYDQKEDLSIIQPLLRQNQASLSYDMDFATFQTLVKFIKRSDDEKAKSKWYLSKWVNGEKAESDFIPVVLKNNVLVPKELSAFIPDSQGFSLTNWIHFWFFQTHTIASDFLGWLKRKFLGAHSEAVLLINETIGQIKKFKTQLEEAKAQGKGLNLSFLSQTAAFQDALEIPDILIREKKRGESLKPSWTVGVLLKWVPFFNRHKNYLFFNIYHRLLEQSEFEMKKDGQLIAIQIVKDLEYSLFDNIKQKVFLLPQNMLIDIHRFLTLYGDASLLAQYNRIMHPINILKKFNFLHDIKPEEEFRSLNEDNVYSFLSFAKKYWTSQQYQAALLISGLILREKLPSTEDELTTLFQYTKFLFDFQNEKEAKKEFLLLLAYIAKQYVFSTGDKGDDAAYLFLKKFYPKGYQNWKDERNENLDDKFIFIRSLLDVSKDQEKNLDPQKQYDAGQIKLEYKNIGKYIHDLKSAQNEKPYMKLLYKLFQNYVKNYSGNNAVYEDIILSLGDVGLIVEYSDKRFSFLLSHADQSITTKDEAQFFSNAVKIQEVTQKLYQILKERYDGSHHAFDQLIENMNHPAIYGIYYAKRLQYLIKNKNYQEVLDSKQLFDIVTHNPIFISEMNEYFDASVAHAIKKNNFSKIETLGFMHMIEKFGSLVNKEAYRVLRIKRLLEINDLQHTQIYVEALLKYIPDLDSFLTLEKGKNLLAKIYTDMLKNLKENNEWRGHLQYLLDFFGVQQSKELLQENRALWLNLFLSKPDKFSEMASLGRPTLDLKYHYENIKIPTTETNLSQYYGKQLDAVFEMIVKRLDAMNEDMSDDVIRLIERYTKDTSFKTHPQFMLLTKKIEDAKRAQQIIQALEMGDMSLAVDLLNHFIEDFEGQKELMQFDSSILKKKITDYQQRVLEYLYICFVDKIQDEIILEQNSASKKLEKLNEQEFSYIEKIKISKFSVSVKERIQDLIQKRSQIFHAYQAIYHNMDIEKLHELVLNEEDAILLKYGVSKKMRSQLLVRIEVILGLVSPHDSLAISLNAFHKYLSSSGIELKTSSDLLNQLKLFRRTQTQYPELAEQLAQTLIERLNSNQSIRDLALFRDKNSTLQYTFAKYLSSKTKDALANALCERIGRLMQGDLHDAFDIVFERNEWLTYSMLYQWLMASEKINTSRLEKELSKKSEKYLSNMMIAFSNLESTMDALLSKREALSTAPHFDKQVPISLDAKLLEKEMEFLKQCLFIRMFGNAAQTEEIDRLLEQVSKRLRQAFMSGEIDPFREHCIKYADKLLTIAGNQNQRVQCAKLMSLWNRYLASNTELLQVQKEAMRDTVPVYLEQFEKNIYEYFIKKYKLDNNFLSCMFDLSKKIKLNEDLFDAKNILSAYSIHSFMNILKKYSQRSSRLGFGALKERDAQKLYIAFCLVIQAKQLASLSIKKLGDSSVRSFDIAHISGILTTTMLGLYKELGIKSNHFQRAMQMAICTDKDYFVSWSNDVSKLSMGIKR
ncbi:hypothetical protein CC99x_007430 [Candidatus Berkiella cookevillensis]|uniref:Uncharacterized protein n=1 Tax=Candidatus Berkiella cookevillensis TaxID=437022 RepID=A0A0Q9YCI9_9GAMM|nr:hypothetical protein [Candidatus Berkiella cookevillensis]MCS5708733.1 hypothetical protein [Candidatus Berkiella cookevillensis]